MSMLQVNLQHVFLVGPLLFYIGKMKNDAPKWSYISLATLTLMIPFIVTYNYDTISYRSLINATHYLVWLPLFLLISYYGYYKKLPPWTFPLIQILGISAIAIHSYLWLEKMKFL